MLGEVSEEPRFSDVAKAAAHYGLCHVSYLGFKSNLFSNITYQSNNSESLFLENPTEESKNRNLYEDLDQYYKLSKTIASNIY